MKKTTLIKLLILSGTLFFAWTSGTNAQTNDRAFCDFSSSGQDYTCYNYESGGGKPSSCSLIGGTLAGGFTCPKVPSGYTPPQINVTVTATPFTGAAGVIKPKVTWAAPNAASDPTSCTGAGVVTGGPAEGSVNLGTVNTPGNITYTILCKNSSGSGSGSAQILVEGNEGLCDFSNSGNDYTCYATSGAKPGSCTLVGGTLAGGFTCPKIPSGYTPPKIDVKVTASPTSGQAGIINPIISWSASNAASDPTSCTGAGIVSGGPASGSFNVGVIKTPGSVSYSISCKNSGGTGVGSINIAVSNPPSPTTSQVSGNAGTSQLSGNGGTTGQVPSTDGTLKYTPLEPLPGLDKSANVDFAAMLNLLFKLLITVGALFSVGTLVWGGVMYMISDAFETKDMARKRMRAAIFGLLIILSSWLILNTINPQLRIFQLNVKNSPGGAAGGQNPGNNPQAAGQNIATCPDGQTPHINPNDTVSCR